MLIDGLDVLLQHTCTALRLDGAAVLRLQDGLLHGEAAAGVASDPTTVTFPLDTGISGRAAANDTVVAADATTAAPAEQPLIADGALLSWAVPLLVGGRCVGVLLASAGQPFSDDPVVILELVAHHVAMVLDRTHLLSELDAERRHYQAVVETAVDTIVTIDADGVMLTFNPAAESMFGWSADEMIGRNVADLMPSPYREEHDRYLARYHATGIRRIIGIGRDVLAQRKDGSTFPVALAVSEAQVAGQRLYTGILRDLTEMKAAEQALIEAALRDPLTGAANRQLLYDRIAHALGRLSRHPDQSVALLFLDLDRFKPVNDAFGHAAGDQVLVTLTERFRGLLRKGDTVARLGGDEFVLLVDEVASPDDVVAIAERVVAAVATPIWLGREHVSMSASVGVVIAAHDGAVTPETLVQQGDVAMYSAKRRGGGRVTVADRDTAARVRDRIDVTAALSYALETGQFRVHYQPQVDAGSGRLTGMEALVRWERPGRGLLAPGAFLDVAHRSGLIVPLDLWVLQTACTQVAQWAQQGFRARLWSNLSPRGLVHPELAAQIAAVLESSGLESSMLGLEIPGRTLLADLAATTETLEGLQQLGIHLAIDDFGTGSTSLAYLQRFPVDKLKIDQSFVAQLDSTDRAAATSARAIVGNVARIANDLGLVTIAEGVETEPQRQACRDLGVGLLQGYLIGRPVAADHFESTFVTG